MDRSRFFERPSISIDQFYEVYFKDSGKAVDFVKEMLDHISLEVGIPAAKLRGSDRFNVELNPGPANYWDSGVAILMYEISHLYKKKNLKLHSVDTIVDYIDAMSLVYSKN